MTGDPYTGENLPALETVGEFLNTLDERRFTLHGIQHTPADALPAPSDLAAWLAGHELIPPGTPATTRDLALAHALRQALRDLLMLRAAPDAAPQAAQAAAAGHAVASRLLRANSALSAHQLRVQADPDGIPVLVPTGHSIPAALAAIAATVALAQAAGTWHRLRICAAPDCRWVFYDTSRPGAARWCSMRICGNRAKTRTYRQRRHRQAERRL